MPKIFNNKLIAKKRDIISHIYKDYNFIKKEATKRLLTKLTEIKKTFNTILDVGSHQGEVLLELQNVIKYPYSLFSTDISLNMLRHHPKDSIFKILTNEEHKLPFKENSFDLIISVLSLHSINDLSLFLSNIYRILKPNGLFLATFPSYNSLSLLAEILYKADIHIFQGISPKVYPFIDIKTIGNLLVANNFQDVIADNSTININYKDYKNIFKDLKSIGETNSLQNNHTKHLTKEYLQYMDKLFLEYKQQNDYYKININLCNIIAWKPN